MKWQVYVVSNNGEGVPQKLMVWDTSKNMTLELRLDAFAEDAIIIIEPYEGE